MREMKLKTHFFVNHNIGGGLVKNEEVAHVVPVPVILAHAGIHLF